MLIIYEFPQYSICREINEKMVCGIYISEFCKILHIMVFCYYAEIN